MLNLISKRKYTYILSFVLVVASIASLSTWGLKLGIDFKGGTLMEVQFTEEEKTPEAENSEEASAQTEESPEAPVEFKAPGRDAVQEKLKDLGLESLNVQESENNIIVLRYIGSDEEKNEQVFEKLREFEGRAEQLRVDFVGSSVSKQLQKNALGAVTLAILGIAFYIAWAFRKVSFPVSSWQYGLSAIVALAHDILITLGIFALLGRFMNVEIGTAFVAAILTILGYSINDTIVVFDRIRENLMRSGKKDDFEEVVNKSIGETLARSINTSMTVIIVLVAIVLFGGESIKYFAVALLIGVGFGTYSSIFMASA
ncbi:protein translocase subunit SecF, partial [bacterium]|nr:protein translocase subunit SecF [bacterium]